MGMSSVDALAMAGLQCMPPEACCSDDDVVDDGMPPEHLRAFEAFLEKVVPVDMIMASRREEDARLQRGGEAPELRRRREGEAKAVGQGSGRENEWEGDA